MIQVNPINITFSSDDIWTLSKHHKEDLIKQLKATIEKDLPQVHIPYSGFCMVFMYAYVDPYSNEQLGDLKYNEILDVMSDCIVKAGIVSSVDRVNTFSAKMMLKDNNQSVTVSIHRMDLVPIPPMPKSQDWHKVTNKDKTF